MPSKIIPSRGLKYMGSKRAMLQNGLGDLLNAQLPRASRFVDLFAGSGAVAIHVARRYEIEVRASDLQSFSAVITGAVITRQKKINPQTAWDRWYEQAVVSFTDEHVPSPSALTRAVVRDCRTWCDNQTNLPVTKAYGGHYFSPEQAVWIDMLRASLPEREPVRTVALAALILAASQCAASPGHTAQPFQPTRTAKPFLQEAWSKNIIQRTKDAFVTFASQFALSRGKAGVADAYEAAGQLKERDLVFLDPPYSGVQYSRFYHVLETVARGECGDVAGVGRYPEFELRPQSKFSLKTKSKDALNDLLDRVASRGASAFLTFPDHQCSNGLSGSMVRKIARKHFRIVEVSIKSRFSTLGGNGTNENGKRKARKKARELILVLHPR
ncbi:MAG: DNA adenine methylase [Nitrospirota bacterium]